MLRALPAPSPAEQQAAVRAAVEEAHRLGITSVHDFGDAPDRLSTFDTLLESGELPPRVYAALPLSQAAAGADLAAVDAARRQYPDDPVFKAGPVSIDVDGWTAAADPAAADHDFAARLGELVAAIDGRRWPVALHAGGRAAVRLSLDAIEHAAAHKGPAATRHRIDGIESLDPADASRFTGDGVVASLRPAAESFTAAAPGLLPASRERRGPDAVWPLMRLQASRARIVFGSDWPALPLDPRVGLDAAIARAAAAGEEPGSDARAAAALAGAIDAYTASPAWTSADDQRKGTLAPDMLADIVILSADIFAPGAHVLDAVVDTTIFDGRVVYARTPAALTE
jgi:predicted amidohydrolase YtcJ